MLEMQRLVLGVCATNCYLVRTKEGVFVIDPADDAPAIGNALAAMGEQRPIVLLTHAHFDHILALDGLNARAVYAHPAEEAALRDPRRNASAQLGMPFAAASPLTPLEDGERIGPFVALHTPGHRPGCLCFYAEEQGVLFSGDTLFCGAYGRLDLPEAQPDRMRRSLERLFALPPETIVYPGHGEATTIGQEVEGWGW